jgi:hypothetical protein
MRCINNPEHRVIIPQDVDLGLLGQLLRDDLRLSDDDCKLYQALRILDENRCFGIPCPYTVRASESPHYCHKCLFCLISM